MNVKELREKLEDAPDEYEVRIDPPYSRLLSAYVDEDEEVVELGH